MYENFVIATQAGVYLFLEKKGDDLAVLYFDSPMLLKYGSPNDEARSGHPLYRYGLGFYGFFEVLDSPLIREQMMANRIHPQHSDSLFKGCRHFIACFKDVMLEVTCKSYEEKLVKFDDINGLFQQQLQNLAD